MPAMRLRLVPVAACLALAAGSIWAATPRAASSVAARPEVRKSDAGPAQPAAEIRRLQQAVAAQEARHRETQRRLQEQDREIQSLRRQLQTGSAHDSAQPD